ncbi:cupin domain-containing protein [Pararhizobium sp. YC-54]|uniref:cupin domain-containing protein n=1 Tax=Pararhizobium sp. YC-54 TaxID=2986920 RepID=UPI0021F77D16|nr:cupin domain-containing protein [Pararhizobium sp. YC-54]MCV9999263.1 cupin domain-containing protein [Pararhizobium sp. YC-54]
MTDTRVGVTHTKEAFNGRVWNILGQTYTLKYISEDMMAWYAVLPPGTFVPPHVHLTQDETVAVLTGRLDIVHADGTTPASAGDYVYLPRNLEHGIYNNSGEEAHALFQVSPARKIFDLFENIHNVKEPAVVVQKAGEREIEFSPPR